MARWLDIALSWKQRGATGAKWPRYQRRGKEVQHWDKENPGDAFLYPYYRIIYHIQFFPIHIESIQIHSIDMYFCDDSLKHRLMVSHHVLTLTCICSLQGYAYCVYSDRCMGATQPVSQSNPACRPAWLLFWTTFQPAICELMYCITVWCVGSRTEKSAKSTPQICRARLHSQTPTVLGSSSLCFSRPVIEFLIVALTPCSRAIHPPPSSALWELHQLWFLPISELHLNEHFTGKSTMQWHDIVKLED